MIEHDLRQLARALDVPPAPDLRAAVLARVARRRRTRRLVLALASLALLALAIALAVPPARTAILRTFHIGFVEVELVDELPQARVQNRMLLGARVTRDEAELRFRHHVLYPDTRDLGAPDEIRFSGTRASARVTLVWGSLHRPKLLLQEFEGRVDPALAKKVAAGGGTTIHFATVNGRPAVGLFGAPHYFMYLDPESGTGVTRPVYLVGNVLLWQSGPITLRLEGDLTFTEMLRIARRTR